MTKVSDLLADHTQFVTAGGGTDVWTVEIKPKWGFLPTSPWVHEKSD